MSVLENHQAQGPAAGYLYQILRVFYWLTNSERGSVVGIETLDDLSVVGPDGMKMEQAKYSEDELNNLQDSSFALWNTLAIWASAAFETKEIDLSNCQLYLTTNVELPDCLARRIGDSNTKSKYAACYSDMKLLRDKTKSLRVAEKMDSVLKQGKSNVLLLVENITCLDSTDNTKSDDMQSKIASLLHIPTTYEVNRILSDDFGWIVTQISSGLLPK